MSSEHKQIADLLEREVSRHGLLPSIEEVDLYDSADVYRTGERLVHQVDVLGYVFDLWWFTSEEYRRLALHLLGRLAAADKPVAVIDELDDFDMPPPFDTNPNLQVFRIDGQKAGEELAQLMIGHGHRKIAYLSSAQVFSWSRHRLQGIQQRFARAGMNDAVVPVVAGHFDIMLLHILEAAELDNATVRAIIGAALTVRQAEDQYRAWKRFKPRQRLKDIDPIRAAALKRDMGPLAKLRRWGISRQAFAGMAAAALDEARRMGTRIILGPLFKEALAVPDVTAWICDTDGTALAALDYLRGHGVDVPGRISVAGFDNSPLEDLKNRLTSYDFNAEAFSHHMISFITRPPRPRGRYHHRPVKIQGMVIERGTTGKAG